MFLISLSIVFQKFIFTFLYLFCSSSNSNGLNSICKSIPAFPESILTTAPSNVTNFPLSMLPTSAHNASNFRHTYTQAGMMTSAGLSDPLLSGHQVSVFCLYWKHLEIISLIPSLHSHYLPPTHPISSLKKDVFMEPIPEKKYYYWFR
jgi:hypothetical protein